MYLTYRQWRIERKYIGSDNVEKANDMLVALHVDRRAGEHLSDALGALPTLMLNGGQGRYWQQ